MYSKLQYISQGDDADLQLRNIQEALDAGCQWIQLRYKNADKEELRSVAVKVRELCMKYKSTFIINDNPPMAAEMNADGVHLGLADMPMKDARTILGPDKIIGGTANTLADVWHRLEEGCDYIGLGPYRFTKTKENLSPILGVKGYRDIMEELIKKNVKTPVYAIGGITLDDVPAIIGTGIYGIAVSGVITDSADKHALIQQFNSLLYGSINNSR